ncbi:N-acetyltransferase GCN5 [Mycobacterium tuberculosis]|nr:N-acetyltransferase GCN5 [Mycobacterium tuberculosis]
MREPAGVLAGTGVALEALAVTHAAGLLAAADETVFAHLPYARPASVPEMAAWIERVLGRRPQRRPYAIVTGDGIAGTTSYWYPDPVRNQIEIGSTWIGRRWWGTGTNAEAKRVMVDHAFDDLNVAKVAFRTDVENLRSQRALEKLGAHRDGVVLRDWPRPDGTWRASVHYSILRGEWRRDV